MWIQLITVIHVSLLSLTLPTHCMVSRLEYHEIVQSYLCYIICIKFAFISRLWTHLPKAICNTFRALQSAILSLAYTGSVDGMEYWILVCASLINSISVGGLATLGCHHLAYHRSVGFWWLSWEQHSSALVSPLGSSRNVKNGKTCWDEHVLPFLYLYQQMTKVKCNKDAYFIIYFDNSFNNWIYLRRFLYWIDILAIFHLP